MYKRTRSLQSKSEGEGQSLEDELPNCNIDFCLIFVDVMLHIFTHFFFYILSKISSGTLFHQLSQSDSVNGCHGQDISQIFSVK